MGSGQTTIATAAAQNLLEDFLMQRVELPK
jgi:hypothetical protein